MAMGRDPSTTFAAASAPICQGMADTSPLPANPTLVLRNVDVALLGKLLQMQRRDGAATVDLIDASQPAPAPRPHEDGKGCLVDCVA